MGHTEVSSARKACIDGYDAAVRAMSAGKVVVIGKQRFLSTKGLNFHVSEAGTVTGLSNRDFTSRIVQELAREVLKDSSFDISSEFRPMAKQVSPEVFSQILEKAFVASMAGHVFGVLSAREKAGRADFENDLAKIGNDGYGSGD